jgi:hypothetical protein
MMYGVAGVGVVGLGVPLIDAEKRMKTTGGPGIVGLELAGPAKVEPILETWGENGRRAARTSLLLDQLWLTTYSVLLAGVWAAASKRLHGRGRRWLGHGATAAGWAALAAGACDAVENTALLGVVTGHGPRHGLARIAQRAAQTKFALLAAPLACAGAEVAARRWIGRRIGRAVG